MTSISETGHAKIETTFFTLKTFCVGFNLGYAPTNPQLTLTSLTTSHAAAKTAIDAVNQQKVPFNNAEGARALTFKPLKPLATRILGSLKSVNAPEATIKYAEQINHKIQGKKAHNTTPSQSPVSSAPAKDPVSTSQQSYDMKLDHFKKLVHLLSAEPLYAPNELELKIPTLLALITILELANQAVIIASVPYSNALIARNTALYDPQTGLVDLAKDVKNYIKSAFGFKSPQFLQIRGLQFRYPTSYYK
jgi:hypothetical protein